jgi:membrane protease YdiL (CAAX protease family)
MPVVQVALLGVGAAYAVSLLGALIRTPTTPNEITKLLDDPKSLILMAVFGITLAPLCEELAFRGFLQPLLVRSLGVVPGILAAALPFGLLHYREYGNSWRHAVIVAAAGAAFGWMRHRTGSTRASTIMHAAYNALFFAAVAGQKASLWR